MSWQTDLFCSLTFNRETFNSLSGVEDKIDELTSYISDLKDTLRNLAMMTEPSKLLNLEEGESPMERISSMVKDILTDLEDYYIERWKLEILKDRWNDCHTEDGLAIDPPENIDWRTAFLDGDFVKSVKHPNGYE